MINAKHGHDHDKNDNDDDDEDASIKASMAACNVCNHAHRLSFTDGPRKGEQASGITMTATNALTNTYGGGASLGTTSSATHAAGRAGRLHG